MLTSFFIRMNNKYVNLKFSEIQYFEACKRYVLIVTDKETYQVLLSMKHLEATLPQTGFVRIHRSFIVAIDRILFFTSETVQVESKALPIGMQYRKLLNDKLISVESTIVPETAINSSN